MQIEFRCACGAKLRTAAANAGKKTKCPKCGAMVLIAAPAAVSDEPVLETVAVPIPAPAAPSPARSARSAGLATGQPASSGSRPAQSIAKPRVVAAKPAGPRPVPAQPVSDFDPLGLPDLNFPQFPPAGATPWTAAGGFAAPRKRRSKDLRWLWISLGAGAAVVVGLIAVVGVGLAIVGSMKRSSRSFATSSAFPGAKPGSGAPAAQPGKKVDGPPLSDAEAEAVVTRFVEAVRSRNFNLCKQLFNVERFYEQIADEVQLSGSERRGFVSAARIQPQLWDQIYPVTRMSGGEYVVLRPVRRGGELRVVVRMSSDQTGLNYHEFITRRNDKGEGEIADVFILTAGNTYGESIREIISAMLAGRNNSLLGRFGGGDKQAVENSQTLQRIKLLEKTAPQQALKEFDKLPPEMQRKKTLMIVRMQLASSAGSDEYARAFEAFRSAYPGDASLDLLSIDYYIDRQDNASALAAAQRLNTYVGGDPLLDEMIAKLQTL